MITIEQALAHILDACPSLGTEEVAAEHTVGRVLRQQVVAPTHYPPFDRVMMDGYAVRAADLEHTDVLPVRGESAAGADRSIDLEPGTCVEAMTGAPLPRGADAVVMVEQTRRDGDLVTFEAPVREGQHYAPAGEEAHAGDVLLKPGDVITPVGVATAASAGHARLTVSRQPSVAAVSTGNELVDVDTEPGPNQIRDTNALTLAAQARANGLTQVRRLRARDTMESLEATLDDALAEDIVIISGGVSMGRYDLVPKALQSRKVEQVFHRVLQKPGKPLWFGKRGEPWLHLALTTFRAIENRLALVRSTNTGVSAFVDPAGRLSAHTSVDHVELLAHDVPLMEGGTVYRAVGDVLGWGALLWAAVIGLTSWRRGRRRS